MVNGFDQLSYTQMAKDPAACILKSKITNNTFGKCLHSDLITVHFSTLLSPFLSSSPLKYAAHILMAALNPLPLLTAMFLLRYIQESEVQNGVI
jgi:hypothetical protein